MSASVINICWERIIVHLDLVLDFHCSDISKNDLKFYAVNGLCSAKAIFEVSEMKGNQIRLSLNVTNPGDKRCLPIGTYKIYACKDEKILACCMVDPSITDKLEECSRNFLYNNRNSVYAITFMVEDGADCLPLVMHTLAAKRTGINFPSGKKKKRKWNKIFDLKKFKRKHAKNFLRKVYALSTILGKIIRNKKVILFLSEQSDQLGENLTAVYDRLLCLGYDKKYILLKSARKAASQRQRETSWLLLVLKLGLSDYVFVDDHAPVLDWLKLKNKTEVIQLWHAGAGFKSSGYSRWGHIGCPAPSCAHRQYKYGIAGSKNIAPFFSEVWGINTENVLPTGMPRMDQYLNSEHQENVKALLYQRFPLCVGKKVILFAPTYRGKNRKTAYYPYELIDFEKLYEMCKQEYVVLFKMHPWVSTKPPISEAFSDKFIDVGDYPNINDLFYITDLLITDYSSNIYEFSLMKKPMLFFAFDKIQYSFSRGFHREYEAAAPGKVCYTFDELLEAIEKQDFKVERVEEYVKHHFDHLDTFSSDRVINWIIEGNLPKEIQEAIDSKENEQVELKKMDFTVLKSNLKEDFKTEDLIEK